MPPVVPASASAWQAPQLFSVKIALPSGAPPPAPVSASCSAWACSSVLPPLDSQRWKSRAGITWAVWRMTEWPRPQSSAQMTG